MFKKAKNVLYFRPREARSNENNSIFASPSSAPSHTPNKARSNPTIHEERWGKRGRTRERQLFENFLLSPTLFLLTPERNGGKLQRVGRRGKERENKFFVFSPPPLFFPQRREIKETRFISPSSFSAIRLEDLRVLILPHLPQGVLLPVRRHPQLELLPEDRGLAGDAKLLRQQFLQWVGDAR